MKGWLSGYFGWNSAKIGFTIAIPQELTRLSFPRAYLNEHIANIKLCVIVKATELVFNIDEKSDNSTNLKPI